MNCSGCIRDALYPLVDHDACTCLLFGGRDADGELSRDPVDLETADVGPAARISDCEIRSQTVPKCAAGALFRQLEADPCSFYRVPKSVRHLNYKRLVRMHPR